jgi:PKD domain
VVAVREDFPGGAVQTALVSGGAGGTVGELAVGRSGLGDGLVAFRQGPLGVAAIVATQVTAPPVRFVLTVPKPWLKPSQAAFSWLPAESANGPLRYTVVLDGRRVPTPAGAFSIHLDTRGLSNGVHKVQVLATDIYGQATLTPASTIRIDGGPPVVKLTRTHGEHAVLVRVSDANSGVAVKAVSVAFGDGAHASKRKSLSHRYSRAGVYQVVVTVSDKLGNKATVRRLVSVR